MKSIFFFIAAACALVGAYLAYENMNKVEGNLASIVDLKNKNTIAEEQRTAYREKLAGLKENIEEQKGLIADANANIESAKSKEGLLKQELVQQEAKLQTIEEEIEGYNDLKDKLDIALRSAGISGSLDDIPAMLESLKTNIQEKEDALKELQVINGKLEEEIAQRSDTKSSLDQRLNDIKTNISYNTTTATITSVNSQWGFVVLNKGASNSRISQGDELLVNRGGKFVGKLRAKTLESTQTICDLDLDGFRGSTLPRPGDRVILRETVKR